MDRVDRIPSSYLPEYFKLDLEVGLSSVHPVAAALDGMAYDISQNCFEEAWNLQPDLMSALLRRKFLEGLGFICTVLSDDEVISLFDQRREILEGSGTLSSIKVLARIYLGPCDVRRGRPHVSQALGEKGATSFLLTDTASSGQLVFIRCQDEVANDRVTCFVESCSQLLPFGTEVQVAPPLRTVQPKVSGFSLAKPISLEPRRL